MQQSFGIKTAGLEDKSTACDMLVCYAKELNEAFVDYVEPVLTLMIPLLKFYFHDDVRWAFRFSSEDRFAENSKIVPFAL